MLDINTPSELYKALVALGISRSYASEISNRKRTPSLALALQIEDALGIKPSFWIDTTLSIPQSSTQAPAVCGQLTGALSSTVSPRGGEV